MTISGLDRLVADIRHLTDRPSCEVCGNGYLRAIDVVDARLDVRCSSRSCGVHHEYALPTLSKTIVYLDTSVISNVALARRPAFRRLQDALREASYRNVIACVVSNVAVQEIELARNAESILEIARELGAARVNDAVRVHDSQIWRAFGRFRRSEASLREVRPPREDVFQEDVNRWPGMLSFRSRFPVRAEELDQRRENKIRSSEALERYYSKYASGNVSFNEIAERETAGFCELVSKDVWLTRRMEYALETQDGISPSAAANTVRQFFASDHAKLLPAAIINGRLHAALALAFRSEKPRSPEEGDVYDIEHLSTYLPYVDLLATDQFMAGVANQGNVRLAKDYGTAVQGLGERQVDEFVQMLSDVAARDRIAELSAAVYDAIAAGGFLEDFVAAARARYPPAE